MPSTASHSTKRTEPRPATAARPGSPLAAPGRAVFAWGWLALTRRAGRLPAPALATRPALLVLATVLVVALCAVLAAWGGRPGPAPPDRAGFSLPAEESSPKLDNTSAEAPAVNSALPPRIALAKQAEPSGQKEEVAPAPVEPPVTERVAQVAPVPDLPPPLAPQPPPVAPEAAPAPPSPRPGPTPVPAPGVEPPAAPPLAPPTASASPPNPEDFESIRDPHRGVSPMMRTWRALGFSALLAAAFTAPPALADNTDQKKTDGEKLDELLKTQKDIKKSLESIGQDLKDTAAAAQQAQAGVAGLSERIRSLEERVRELESKVGQGPTVRKSGFGPIPNGKGRIRLVNRYNARATVILNSRPYPLQPGQEEVVDVPAGNYTYLVLVDGYGEVLAATSRPIAANESRTIEVF